MDDVWGRSELLLKVKEPIAIEYPRLRPGLTLFTYLHIAADEPLTRALVDSGITGIAYETVETDSRRAAAARADERDRGPARPAGRALTTSRSRRAAAGSCSAASQASRRAGSSSSAAGWSATTPRSSRIGLGAQVTILERSVDRMRYLEQILSGRVTLLMSSSLQIEESIREADLVIGAVLIPGALAPKLITREMLGAMKEASVLVDVAIDQGGCAETSRPTTHDDPVYTVDGVIHYCVANMPGAVPITSTRALTNVTLPYVETLADYGVVARDRSRSRARTRRQRLRRADHVRGGRRGARARVHAARRRAAPQRVA